MTGPNTCGACAMHGPPLCLPPAKAQQTIPGWQPLVGFLGVSCSFTLIHIHSETLIGLPGKHLKLWISDFKTCFLCCQHFPQLFGSQLYFSDLLVGVKDTPHWLTVLLIPQEGGWGTEAKSTASLTSQRIIKQRVSKRMI